MAVVHSRRSVPRFSDIEVDPDILAWVVDAAVAAPFQIR